jgi:hypothetical protein
MALRWCAAGMIEASGQFRRVNGHLHLPALRRALNAHVAKNVGPIEQTDDINAAHRSQGRGRAWGWSLVAYRSPDQLGLIYLHGTVVASRARSPHSASADR